MCNSLYEKGYRKIEVPFIMAIFIGCYVAYTLVALFNPTKTVMLDISDLGKAFLLISVIFGVMIPVQFRFGYEKSRYIFFFFDLLDAIYIADHHEADAR